jgi:hypothetical protein
MEKPDPKLDGVTHINCWSKGKTTLGQLLSNFAQAPFKHPQHGFFASVEGYWYWLSTGRQHDNLRRLYGASAKTVGMQFEMIPMDDEEFKDQIRQAIRCKIEQNADILAAFLANPLPYFHYYVYGKAADVIVDKPEHRWQMEYLHQLRAELLDVRHQKNVAAIEEQERILSPGQLSDLF